MGRPKTHDATTALSLLDAAEGLLAEGGPDAVSVRAVADAVGTTTRAVYSSFGSKEGLVQRLSERGYLLLAELVNGLPTTADPGADLIEVGIGGFREFAMTRPHLFRLTFERLAPDATTTPSVAKAARASYAALRQRIQRVADAGELGGRLPDMVLLQFHSVCQGLATSELQALDPPVGSTFWRMLPDPIDARVWRDVLTLFVRGMSVEPDQPARVSRTRRSRV